MCRLDIEDYFPFAPTPVFLTNGKSYSVRTRFCRNAVYAEQLQNGSWRPAMIQFLVGLIKCDERFHQRNLDCPGARYWVHSVRLNRVASIDPDDLRAYHTPFWQAALVRP